MRFINVLLTYLLTYITLHLVTNGYSNHSLHYVVARSLKVGLPIYRNYITSSVTTSKLFMVFQLDHSLHGSAELL